MPWPSSLFLADDPTTPTGYRLAFGPTTLPANVDGVHVDPAPYARMDGYSVSAPMVVAFPDIDLAPLPDETQLASTLDDDSPVVLLQVDEDGGLTRVPCWFEADGRAKDPARRSLFIRPARILRPGTRYIAALRGLTHADGSPIAPSAAFAALRDGATAGTPLAGRQARFDEIFALLEAAGVARGELTLAWDFVTASDEALHGDMLAMRDDALAKADAAGIPMTVTSVEEFTPEQNDEIAFEVTGTFEVPHYMEPSTVGADGATPAWRMHRGADGRPAQDGTRLATFRARVPRTALDGTPHGILIHGHGLNGTSEQIHARFYDDIAVNEHVIIAGCDMVGMSEEDVPVTVNILYDMSYFPALADRLHQGVLEHLLLTRAMRDSFDQIPEIAARGVVVDDAALYYSGISQGGIFGGTIMALSTDIVRGHLGVPGNTYALLLTRSVDFDPFFVALSIGYRDPTVHGLLLSIVQTLWDRTDPASYLRHISVEPFPGTPAHAVLLASAQGDWQVANVSNENALRSDVGIALMANYGRDVPFVEPTAYPHAGSGLVSYSFGNPWAPPGAQPPPTDEDLGDPHGKPRKLSWHNEQMFHFFRTGEILDVCGGDGCTPD